MGLLDKVKNVVRENLPDAVTNTDISGQGDAMIEKFDKIGLITGSKLIVRETQEAIFMRNGIISQIFGPGKYDLETDNIPLAKSILTMVYGGTNPNAAEIWFVNKSSMMNVEWGTPAPISIEDKRLGALPITLSATCNGTITVKVTDSRLLFTEMVGVSGGSFTMKKFNETIRSMLTSRLLGIVGKCMEENQFSLVQLERNINFLEDPMTQAVTAELSRYGLIAIKTYVGKFKAVEDESWKHYKEYEREIVQSRMRMDLEKERMEKLGYDYATERQFDVMQTAAGNEGNPMVNAPIGLGVGFGAAASMAPVMAGVAGAVMPGGAPGAAPAAAPAPKAGAKCPKCSAAVTEGSKFCPECGFVLKGQCLACGATLGAGKFCPECGKKLVLCPQCGSDTEPGAANCQKCGASLAAATTCPSCGKEYDKPMKFCAECGTKME